MTLKVFGIGLSKTGTKTLGSCLMQLGFNHLSGRLDLLRKYREGRLFEVFDVMDRFDSFEDDPYPYMFRELFVRYGDQAKFIFTRRLDADTWLKSLKRHCLVTKRSAFWHLLGFGSDFPHGLERRHLDFYEAHDLEVRQFFRRHNAEDRLLDVCWERGDGWEKLCRFLDRPVSAAPVPHENAGVGYAIDKAVVASNLAQIRRQLILLGKEDEAARFTEEVETLYLSL
jgi:hypothetical protein